MISIAVIPYMFYRNIHTGQKITKFSVFPDGNPNNWERVTAGWTWGITDSFGRYTEGACRVPATTPEEANQIAQDLAGPDTEVSLWVEV